MEDEETLQTSALVSLTKRNQNKLFAAKYTHKGTVIFLRNLQRPETYQFPYLIEDLVDNTFSNGVVTTSIVVSGILFASHQLVWVEQLSVCATTNFV